MKNKVIKYESSPVDPQPQIVYQDAIFRQKAGDTAPIPNPVPVNTNVAAPDELPPAPEYEDAIFRQIDGDTAPVPDPIQVEPEEVPIDPGLGGGDGSGSASGVGPANDFEPHMMYDPATGQGYMANTFNDHLYYESLGYVHEKPGDSTDGSLALIGLGAILYVGSMLLG